jgi:hypothetical protein
MVNRDNGEYIIDTPHGYVFPKLPELEIVHTLSKDNGVLYCLSTCADVLEYEVTVSAEELVDYQNNSNITITSTTERTVEVPAEPTLVRARNENGTFIGDDPSTEADEAWVSQSQTSTVTVYDVVYTEPYVVPQTEGEGLKVITQQEWDDTITEFDSRQEEKRYNILRDIRDKILEITDWIVIRDLEQQETVSTEFKIWRQELRDLPNSVEFPTFFPTPPTELENNTEIQELYSRFDEVRGVSMINDPLPPLPELEELGLPR